MRPVILFSIACVLVIVSCKQKQESIQPVRENITESVYASGIVKSDQQYQVFAKVSGIITALLVKEGDHITKGTSILQLEDTTARLQAANARVAARYGASTANTERLQELQVAIEQAGVQCQNDSLLLERQRNLWAQQIGSRNNLEQREVAYSNSRNNYRVAQLRYTTLQRQIRFQEQQSANNWQIARAGTSDYTVKSEVNGKVYTLLREKGEMVTPQTPVAVIGDAALFLLELQVDEFDIARVKQGLKVLITMDSYKGQVFEGRVLTIYPFMDQRTKTFKVEAAFVNAPPVLYPNLTCEANIIIREKQNSLTIPASFLLQGGYVMLLNKEKRKVSTGMKDYRKIEILDGITARDVLIKPAQ
ncbi:efflux RND transporter periplasmic adaptor subunit [Paraflavitalea soli]|uniref:Efflux RND transporter periplasmic adaptor subunit n=2 Tax=Paraflavitalea soli TaxID=2315862 RepID=A0A3B7MI09_9BACT|nr:efflux RND transporter periplasmic adaptor subunit [Paraflavitalea soli]